MSEMLPPLQARGDMLGSSSVRKDLGVLMDMVAHEPVMGLWPETVS